MPSFVIDNASQTGQSLESNETGVVTSNGSVSFFDFVNANAAINMTGRAALTVNGTVTGLYTAIQGHDIFISRIIVGQSGMISSGVGISTDSTQSISIINAGSILGSNYGLISATSIGDSGHNFSLNNSGDIIGMGYSGIRVTVNDGQATITNSGLISGSNYAIELAADTGPTLHRITNSGVIELTGEFGTAIYVGGGSTSLTNTGHIIGDISLGSINNTVINSGTITGDIFSSSGSDFFDLTGGTVTGKVEGGGGDDQYIISSSTIILAESAGGGSDTVRSSVSYTLSANFEDLILTGNADITGKGNSAANAIVGNDGENILRGYGGADLLDGGASADTMAGGTGNDVYTADTDDVIIENSGQGFDTVDLFQGETPANYVLASNVENLNSYLGGPVTLTGNSSNNTIVSVGNGNDTLNGLTGTDTLSGGTGNDTYITDGGDILLETSGTDTVQSSVSFTLASGFEKLVLTGTAAINGTGNSAGNSITGNSAANSLDGAGGTDTMTGGSGNDTFTTDGGDTLSEAAGGGTDTVRSSVSFTLATEFENLVLTGSSAINGTGNAAANTITGNGAGKSLNGAAGSDTMTGGAGKDTFIFNSALGSSNVDRITDYSAADDTFRLDDLVFTGLATGTLAASAYVQNTTGTAADASDRIIYETDTGKVFFDRDGTGAATAVQFATIGTNLVLTSADFVVF